MDQRRLPFKKGGCSRKKNVEKKKGGSGIAREKRHTG